MNKQEGNEEEILKSHIIKKKKPKEGFWKIDEEEASDEQNTRRE
jgi:hypothetical protein